MEGVKSWETFNLIVLAINLCIGLYGLLWMLNTVVWLFTLSKPGANRYAGEEETREVNIITKMRDGMLRRRLAMESGRKCCQLAVGYNGIYDIDSHEMYCLYHILPLFGQFEISSRYDESGSTVYEYFVGVTSQIMFAPHKKVVLSVTACAGYVIKEALRQRKERNIIRVYHLRETSREPRAPGSFSGKRMRPYIPKKEEFVGVKTWSSSGVDHSLNLCAKLYRRLKSPPSGAMFSPRLFREDNTVSKHTNNMSSEAPTDNGRQDYPSIGARTNGHTQTNPFSRDQILTSSNNPFSDKYLADHADNERVRESGQMEDKTQSTNPFSLKGNNDSRRPKRAQVSNACNNCRKKKAGCDRTRPCKRCVSGGEEASCCDTPRKKRSTVKHEEDTTTNNSDTASSGSSSSGSNGSNSNTPPIPINTLNGPNGLNGLTHHNHLHHLAHPPAPPPLYPPPRLSAPNSPPLELPLLTRVLPSIPLRSVTSPRTETLPRPPSPLNSPPSPIINNGGSSMVLCNLGTQEVQSAVNNMYKDKDKITRLLVYLTDKYGERELLTGVTESNSSAGTEGIDSVLIRDYTKSIFEKAAKSGDWNTAVATIVQLVDDGVRLLNMRRPRSAMLFFTGYLEGLYKYDPWSSCFAQNHRHTADVPTLVNLFCGKLLEYEQVFNDYEWEIIKMRLEPFGMRMDKTNESFRKIMPDSGTTRSPSLNSMDNVIAKKLTQIRLPSIQNHQFDTGRKEESREHVNEKYTTG
ncbi:hypothetical protein PROFUN_11858 [Planoprotostelium fungivorum]|uniref:Zn(2)-C6 fungal-type domain-containing protein n=1 Tax=Planoprotostelium fungivorum TaxID=1890364 RepID=A0A2P6N9C0_9EUKA|nr:hypothetical protein PROFUN_11858 [Planoprotostelium fungivorum]